MTNTRLRGVGLAYAGAALVVALALQGCGKSGRPDCSTVGCPKACECTEAHCGSQVDECLADNSCAGGKECVDACKCGDLKCLLDCAQKHPSKGGAKLSACVTQFCKPSAGTGLDSTLPSCATVGCPTACKCAMANCSSQVGDCFADKDCAAGKPCVELCKCGDVKCLLKCAQEHPSEKGDRLSSCMNKLCQPPAGTELDTSYL